MTGLSPSLPRRIAAAALVVNSVALLVALSAGRLTVRSGFLLNLLTLVLLAAQLPGARTPQRRWVEARWQIAALGLVLVVGVAMRTLLLDRFPPPDGQLWEETQTGKVAFDSIRSGSLDPYFPLTNFIGEAGLRIFGVSLHGLRLAFVALSIASVPVFFAASRWLLRTPLAALLCTGLFAANAFLAGAGRVALETMAPVFTVSLALAWTFRAAAEQSYAAFALAGFANGLLLVEYFGYKLIPPLAFGFLALALLQPAPGAFCNVIGPPYDLQRLRRGSWRLVVFALFAAAVVAPLVAVDPRNVTDYFLEGYQRQLVGIESATAGLDLTGRLDEAFDRIGQAVSFVFWRGNDNDLLPESMGIVDRATGWIGVLALAYALARCARCPAKGFLVAGVASITVLSGLLVGNPARYRLAAMVPLYLLVIGVAADDVLAFGGRLRKMTGVVVVAGLIVVAAWNVQLFYGRVVGDREVMLEFDDLNLVLAERIAVLQARDRYGLVFLLSDRVFLGQVNDYEFLYDVARVRVAGSAAEVGGMGYVLAHDDWVDQLHKVQGAFDCRREETWAGVARLASCRLG